MHFNISSVRYIDGTIQMSLQSAHMETSLFWQKAPTLCLQHVCMVCFLAYGLVLVNIWWIICDSSLFQYVGFVNHLRMVDRSIDPLFLFWVGVEYGLRSSRLVCIWEIGLLGNIFGVWMYFLCFMLLALNYVVENKRGAYKRFHGRILTILRLFFNVQLILCSVVNHIWWLALCKRVYVPKDLGQRVADQKFVPTWLDKF